MKKTTIFILAAVFLLSVLVVGIFGMKVFSFTDVIHVESINPTEVILSDGSYAEIKETSGVSNTYYVRVPYVEDLAVSLGFSITPSDATDRRVSIKISYDSSGDPDNPTASLVNGVLTFHRKGNVFVDFRALDGSKVYMQMRVYTK